MVSPNVWLAEGMEGALVHAFSNASTDVSEKNDLQSALIMEYIIGTTALILAVLWNRRKMVRLLIEACASLDSSVNGSTSVLALACISSYFSLAAELYAAGARDPRIDPLALSRIHHDTSDMVNSDPQQQVITHSKADHAWPQLGKTVLPVEALYPALHPQLSSK